jgi:UDP-N-acetylglucosamine:LPS N-acetylglucosamine transferase
MPNLLILSSDTGEGHNSAAAAIGLAARVAGLNAVIRKPLEASGAINRSLANLYNTLLAHRPRMIRQYFWALDRIRPNERGFFYSRAQQYIGRFLDSEQPDILLSVHPMLNHFIQRFIKEHRIGIPCCTFLTDPFPPFWRGWASPYVDRYFVATDEALQALTAMGVSTWHIERVPMPVRHQFAAATMSEIRELRSILKLDDATIILINGGARGGGPILKIYQTIRQAVPASNIFVVCGRNNRLRLRIEGLRDRKTWTFGFLGDIHRYIAASDLVVTKPGALSTYEALACRVPVVLTAMNDLMPQESGLFHAAVRYDFGFTARTFDDLSAIVRKGPHEWSRKRVAIADFYSPSAGEELIERIHSVNVGA